jgi:phosphoglycolate phosphatase-like HAD superfamily hydrolase
MGDKLKANDINPRLFFHALQVECERDEVYMKLAERPSVSLAQRWMENFPRVLYQIGLSPEKIDIMCVKEDVEYITTTWLDSLRPRPGLAEMLKTLDKGGVDFYCASGAHPDRVKRYFDQAQIEMPESRIINFLEVDVHKPAPSPYKFIIDKFAMEKPDEVMIFSGKHPRSGNACQLVKY